MRPHLFIWVTSGMSSWEISFGLGPMSQWDLPHKMVTSIVCWVKSVWKKHCVLHETNGKKALCAEWNRWNKKHCVLNETNGTKSTVCWMKQMEQKALCADLVNVKKKQWVLEQISTLHFMVCDAWKLSSKPLGLVDQPLLVELVLQG